MIDLPAALLPQPTIDSDAFWKACNEGKLLLQTCEACGHVFYYARAACPSCGGRVLRWTESRGRGRVFSYSHVHVSFFGEAWTPELPYTVVLVDLDEGPRMVSRLVGDDREAVAVGDAVMVRFERAGDQALPYFARTP